MEKEIIVSYSVETDMTFILEEIYNDEGETISVEIKGFYFGQPEEQATNDFYGKLKVEF